MDKMLLVMAATVGIASWNFIIQQRLSGLNSMSLLFWLSVGQVVLPFFVASILGKFAMPTTNQWKWIVVSWVLLTVANGLYFLAYNRGIQASTATLIMVLMPVFVIVIGAVAKQSRPSVSQMFAVLFAAAAVWLASH